MAKRGSLGRRDLARAPRIDTSVDAARGARAPQTERSRSVRIRVKGRVTIIGFDIRPRRNPAYTRAVLPRTYAQRARNQKKAQRTSLRSETHATDSTCSGWSAKTNATNVLGQKAAVARNRNRKRKTEAAAWMATLTRWCAPASSSKSSRSSKWERRVTGNQLAASVEVMAEATLRGLM